MSPLVSGNSLRVKSAVKQAASVNAGGDEDEDEGGDDCWRRRRRRASALEPCHLQWRTRTRGRINAAIRTLSCARQPSLLSLKHQPVANPPLVISRVLWGGGRVSFLPFVEFT